MGSCPKTIILIRLFVVMSIFNFLFGCKQMPIKGPDFSETIFKVIHIGSGISMEYEMPGNMSEYFNYDQRYKSESERTLKVDLVDLQYGRNTWQLAWNLDGAAWEYTAGKSQGLNGELGSISFNLFAGRYSGDLNAFVAEAYDEYFNGPEGANTEVRKIAKEERKSADELDFLMVKPPQSFATQNINGTNYLHWKLENEHPGRTYDYFLYRVDDQHYLAFMFYHTFSAGSEEELAQMKTLINEDIDKFMSHVFIKR